MMNAQDAIYQAAGFDTLPDNFSDTSLTGIAEAVASQQRAIADGALLNSLYGSQALAGGTGDYKTVSESYRMNPVENTTGAASVRLVRGMP